MQCNIFLLQCVQRSRRYCSAAISQGTMDMASKGPKTTAKPAAPKPVVRAKTPAAPAVKAAPAKAEKPAPVIAPEPVAPVAKPEPVPVAAVSQEAEKAVEAVETKILEPVAEQAQAAVAETVDATAAAGEAARETLIKETITMQATIENSTAKAQAVFTDFNDRTKLAVEKSTKMVEEANDFAKGNLEAVVESSRIAAKGFETMGQEAAEYGRKSFENATAVMKTLATVKSPTDFFKLQSDFVRTSFDSYVAEASKNTEAMLKLAGDAAQPLSNRLALAAEKVKTVA
ncbi:phasin family protein [Sphingomonas sp. M1-B02]|uniref:phasin family protein n=1 Tax=Sphingomonas sp. M1-B02 TaxID=3114300 RepID=UPI00223EBC66|nr:phasin family protein [Sphingomonas sp. S6-11]UZK67993.1 phasin family protein [Sphingomonas sp. S6-11]